MNGKRAKALKKEVFDALYGRDLRESSSREDIKAAYDSPEFKAMYRARKKNENKARRFVTNI